MESLHTLRTELLGVRIVATNQTLWNIGATVSERARAALNDAVGVYKFRVTEIHSSLMIESGALVGVLPPTADRIISVHAVDSSYGTRTPIRNYRHVATPQTNLLHIEDVTVYPVTGRSARFLEVEYEARLKKFPEDTFLGVTLGIDEVRVAENTGQTVSAVWAPQGYLELSSVMATDVREIVRYQLATTGAFVHLTRGVGGVLRTWEPGSRISAVFEGADDAIPVIMASAEASMYHFWMGHRAMYDQWTAVAGIQQLSTQDLLGLVRSEEDRADRRYIRVKTAPEPTTAHTRKRPFNRRLW